MVDEPTLSQWMDQARAFVDERKYLHALQYEAAEKTLLKAVSASSEPQEILFLVGNLYLKLGRHNRALTYYKKLLTREQSLSKDFRAHLHFNAGLAFYYRENPKQSEHHFRRTKKIDPYFPKINESLGELLLRRGQFTEAILCLKQAVRLEPQSWIGHYLLGIAYTKVYDWRDAYEEFVRAVDMDPSEPRAWHMCGEVLLNLHKLDEAERYLHKSLELNPQLTEAVVDFGFLFLKRGDVQRARECFERALELEPQHPKALQGTRELTLSQQTHS